jgi:hypothetical protein
MIHAASREANASYTESGGRSWITSVYLPFYPPFSLLRMILNIAQVFGVQRSDCLVVCVLLSTFFVLVMETRTHILPSGGAGSLC